MRIGLVIYGALDTRSGGYLYDKQVVEGLIARGHRVEVISLPWGSYGRRLLQTWSSKVREKLAGFRVDVLVQDELNHPSLFRVNRAIRARGGPPICTIVHHLRSDEENPAWAGRFYQRVERAYLRTVDGAICNSETTRARVAALVGDRLEASVALPAGDHIGAPEAGEIVRYKRGLAQTERELRVLLVGNVIARKGLHHVILGLAGVRQGWRLTVAGSLEVDTRYVVEVMRMVERFGVMEQVRFLGRVTDDALRALYASHHVLALPSYEGYGIVYLEAMGYAMPCLASTAGAAHEIVTDGVNGFLVTPGNVRGIGARLGELAVARARLAEMVEEARARSDAQPTWADATDVVENFLAGFAR